MPPLLSENPRLLLQITAQGETGLAHAALERVTDTYDVLFLCWINQGKPSADRRLGIRSGSNEAPTWLLFVPPPQIRYRDVQFQYAKTGQCAKFC